MLPDYISIPMLIACTLATLYLRLKPQGDYPLDRPDSVLSAEDMAEGDAMLDRMAEMIDTEE